MVRNISAYFVIIVLITGVLITPLQNISAQDSEEIFPDWVRTVFKFWANGDISDKELKGALEYLFSNGILSMEEKKTTTQNQKSEVTINDKDFFAKAQNAITGWVKEIQNNPTADIIVSSVLPEIPVVGNLLSNLYENSKGTPAEKNQEILKLLKEYQQMNEADLKKSFTQLEENKDLILKNQYRLDQVLDDTKNLLKGQDEIKDQISSLRTELISLLAANGIENKVDRSKKGTVTPELQKQLDEKQNEILQLNAKIQELTNEKPEVDVDTSEKLANAKLYSGDFNGAIEIYKTILEEDEHNFDALIGIAWAHFDLEKPSESIEWFEKALDEKVGKNAEEMSDAFTGLGMAHITNYPNEDYDAALKSFDKAIEANPNNPDAHLGKGYALIDLGMYDEAKIECQKALDIEYDEAFLECLNEANNPY